MSVPQFPATDPTAQPEEMPFYDGLRVGEVRVPWCSRCDRHVWRPKSHCTACYEPVDRWRTLEGTGEVYSFCVVHRGVDQFAGLGPYVLAWVSLDDGPTILANIAELPGAVRIGLRVRIAAPDVSDGPRRGPVFTSA